jgi:hypothetical protein
LGNEGEEEKEKATESATNSTRHANPPLNRDDAEQRSVKHVSKVHIKTFSAAVAKPDSREGPSESEIHVF